MIYLFDRYDVATQDLHRSLQQIGQDKFNVVCKDDGWLPNGVHSPYKQLTGYRGDVRGALYFNELPVSEGYVIENKGSYAEITNLGYLVGRAHYYGDISKRLIGSVEWFDRYGQVFVKDYYCADGFRFRTDTIVDGKVSTSSWMTTLGDVVLHKSYASGLLVRTVGKSMAIFKDEVEFLAEFITRHNFGKDKVLFNSLALPFSLIGYLNPKGEHILYWQENPKEVPANLITFSKMNKRNKVFYRCIEQADLLHDARVSATFLPPIFDVGKKPVDSVRCFTLTNTDNVVNLESLVLSHPNIEFHVGALTNMSDKLLALGSSHPNLVLYPNLSEERVSRLIANTNVYLDINSGSEVSSVVRKSVLSGSLLIGYQETMHQPTFSVSQMFPSSLTDGLGILLENISMSEERFASVLSAYHTMLHFSTEEQFSKICQ